MRTIKKDEELGTLVKVGDIVQLEGFTDEPVIAVVARGKKGEGCSGCAIDTGLGCSVVMRDPTGAPHAVSPCCLRPLWRGDRGSPIFGTFKELDKVLEDL